jgi:hypothetical protein
VSPAEAGLPEHPAPPQSPFRSFFSFFTAAVLAVIIFRFTASLSISQNVSNSRNVMRHLDNFLYLA